MAADKLGPDRRDRGARFVPGASASSASDKTPNLGSSGPSSAAITPPTEEEINRFCEEANMVRPDPNDERACASFASWLVEWRHTGQVPRV